MIIKSQWNLIDSLNLYHQEYGLNFVMSNDWMDFGHVNTYYNSKANFTTQRAFNQLKITTNFIEKSSSKDNKILAESEWFNNIPHTLHLYIPQYLGSRIENEKVSYQLEYLYFTALNELYVFAQLPCKIWKHILSTCFEFLTVCQAYKAPVDDKGNTISQLFGKKTAVRLQEYCQSKNIDINQKWTFNNEKPVSIYQILRQSEQFLPEDTESLSVLHGDFCFSNILYDFRTNRIKVIDPRGITLSGDISIYGDVRYDVAKLSHSILGLYDWILAGYYNVSINGNSIHFSIAESVTRVNIQEFFIERAKEHFKLDVSSLYAMQIQLFLSMLPLHADEPKRQDALFANAFRLYHKLTGVK